MANRNAAGFGLIAQGRIGGTPAAQGQSKYYIDAAYDTDSISRIICSAESKVGYVKTAQAAITKLTLGVLNGIFYNASSTH